MVEGEKTFIFWIGLIVLGLTSVVLFSILWSVAVAVWEGYVGTHYARSLVPFLFGGVVFVLIGLYMMKSGVKRKEERRPAENRPVGGVVHCFACGTPNPQDAVYCKKCGQQLATG
jgi:uncharacterized membrane protein